MAWPAMHAAKLLGNVSRRFSTPAPASILVGLILVILTWVYLLANSVQNAFTAVIDVSGLLFAVFYILTALATIAYYRRRVLTSGWNALVLGVLPIAAAGFLAWIVAESVRNAPAGTTLVAGGRRRRRSRCDDLRPFRTATSLLPYPAGKRNQAR